MMDPPEEQPTVSQVAEDWVVPGPIPWEDPKLPGPAALLATLREVLWRPANFFQGMPRTGWAQPLGFGMIVGTTGLVACIFWDMLAYLWLSQAVAGTRIPQIFTLGSGTMITLMLLSPGIILADLGLSSLCLWGGVALVGIRPGGFTPAWRIFNYAQGAMTVALIPFFGGPLGALWVLYLTYQGVKMVFGISALRALGALAISLVLQAFLLILFLGALVALLGLTGFWFFFG